MNMCDGEPTDKSDVTNWETVASYVATFPADDGEGACDVSVQIGEAGGAWFVRTSDDSGGSDDASDESYPSEDAARAAAEAFAAEHTEGEGGEDAADYLTRQTREAAGEPERGGGMSYAAALARYERLARDYRGKFRVALVAVPGGFIVRSPWIGDTPIRECQGNVAESAELDPEVSTRAPWWA